MPRDNREALAELKMMGDNLTIRLVSNLIKIEIDKYRILNDMSSKDDLLTNQGSIQGLQRIHKLLTGKEYI